MWLAVDSGNTRLKWALMNGKRIISQAAMPKNKPRFPVTQPIRSVWVSHVGSDRELQRLKNALAGLPRMRLVKSRRYAAGVHNGYQPPSALGSDRWLCLLAARQLMGGTTRAALIVSAGTAVTIDVLLPHGQFVGGLILPGLMLMPAALTRATELPPLAAKAAPPLPFLAVPATTTAALATGASAAAAGAVQFARRRYAPGARVLLTGGDAARLHGYLPAARLIPDLLFQGMACLRAA